MKLDQTTPQTTVGTFTFPKAVISNSGTSEFIVKASNLTGYKQTFRAIEGTRLEWLWGNATTEDLYMSFILGGGQNRIRTNLRDFNIYGANNTEATPLFIIKASDGSGDATFKGKIIKSGGTSLQFLKADGSVDSSTYLTTPYTLPIASAATLGGVKVGTGLSIDAGGILSASGGGAFFKLDQTTPESITTTLGNVLFDINDGTNTFLKVNAIANGTNAFGTDAGVGATAGIYSNFFGETAGYGATDAYSSNFFGTYAGYLATGATQSNFFGDSAGAEATLATGSNFFGNNCGVYATNAAGSNFFGTTAGAYAVNAYGSNFFGFESGNGATNAYGSNFFSNQAGIRATDATNANFFGVTAGFEASNAYSSNFFGSETGYGATNAYNSNFFGALSGYGADFANESNFFGFESGNGATNAYNSNFFGALSGYGAQYAALSNFFGRAAGNGSAFARDSIFIGTDAGGNDSVNNTLNSGSSMAFGSFTGTGGFSDSIVFGTGSINSQEEQINFGNSLFINNIKRSKNVQNATPQTSSMFGLGTNTPTERLSIVGGTQDSATTFTGAGTDDGFFLGTYTGTYTADATYRVTITNRNSISTHSLYVGGTNYVAGTTFTVTQSGATVAIGIVDTVVAGVVTQYHFTFLGNNYTTGIKNTVRTSGTTGTGLRIRVLTIADQFEAKKDGAYTTGGFLVLGATNLFTDGLQFYWLTYINHTIGDYWEKTVTAADIVGIKKYDGTDVFKIDKDGLMFPLQASSAPAYVKGAIYFDTTLNKLRVGWTVARETVTSI